MRTMAPENQGESRRRACQHFDLDFPLSRIVGSTFLLFKPPNLRYFVMAVVVNEYKTKYNLPITIFSGSKENQNISSMEVDCVNAGTVPLGPEAWEPIRFKGVVFSLPEY